MIRVAAVILSYNDAASVAEAVRSIGAQARAQELCGLMLAERDVRRVALSLRTWTRLGRHLVKQLAS